MIKKISILSVLCYLIIGGFPPIMAQKVENKTSKKELLMSEDDLVNALVKIAIEVQKSEKKNTEANREYYNELLNSFSTSSGYGTGVDDGVNYNPRFDRIEALLSNMMLLMGQPNGGGRDLIIGSGGYSSSDQMRAIDGLQKQIDLMQEQISTIIQTISDTTLNSSLNSLSSQIYLLKSEIDNQEKDLIVTGKTAPEVVKATSILSHKDQDIQVFFDFNSSQVSKEAKIELNKIVEQMSQHISASVSVIGSASPEGNAAYNNRLAQKRAQAVCDYLVSKGIAQNRIKISAIGVDNDSDVLSFGRRVVIKMSGL